jgi:ATP adenylyltransferase/5',5'''-P-1,P-4-tetraphosphate phosphorylase II
MNLSFWKQVSTSWQSVQTEAVEDAVNIELLRNVMRKDIASSKGADSMIEPSLELTNDDDFWGGL